MRHPAGTQPPAVYVGSATAAAGAAQRHHAYTRSIGPGSSTFRYLNITDVPDDPGRNSGISTPIWTRLRKGWTITTQAPLLSMKMPPGHLMPELRRFLVALEAVFTTGLWTLAKGAGPRGRRCRAAVRMANATVPARNQPAGLN